MSRFTETTAKTVDDAVDKALEELGIEKEDALIEVLEEDSGGFLGIGAKATVRVSEKEDDVPDEDAPEEVCEDAEESEAAASDDAEEAEAADADDAAETAEAEKAEEKEESGKEETPEQAEDAGKDKREETFEEKVERVAGVVEEFLQSIVESFNLEDVNHVSVKIEDGRILADIDGSDCGILIGRKGETLRSLQYITSLVANKAGKARMRMTLDIGGYKAKRENSVASLAIRTAHRALRTEQAYELTPMSAAERRVVHEALQGFKGVTTYSEGEEPNRYVVIDLTYEDEEDYTEDEE